MVLGEKSFVAVDDHQSSASSVWYAAARSLLRCLHAIDFVSRPDYCEAHQRRRVRLSRSGAVLVGFFIFHAFPNALLLTAAGRRKYSHYGKYHSTSLITRFIELFLLAGGATHGILAIRKAFDRWKGKTEVHPHSSLVEMMLTGSIILSLMSMHLFDFRFDPNEDEQHLDEQVLDTLDRKYHRMKNAMYWVFIFTTFVHCWRGTTKAWLFRLGFREEIPLLHKLCRALLVSSLGLYMVPLLMENPYTQDPGSPVRGPRIITVD
jgi:succinate dehydrogenase/fumarate reductase cytochrome b subunit